MATRRITFILITLGALEFLLSIAIRLSPLQVQHWLNLQPWYSPEAAGRLLWMSGVLVIVGAAIALSRRRRRTRLAIQLLLSVSLVAAGVWLVRVWQPGDLLHRDHFEPVLAMMGALIALLGTFTEEAEPKFTEQQLQRNRRQMLARVRHDWIEGVLDQSLYKVARIDLGLEDRPEAVENPLTLIVQEAGKAPRHLPPRTKITSVFDEHAGAILILGAPGAGKTTLLLELAQELLIRAGSDESYPIPVVFNLSSWAVRRAPLADWLIDELNQRYDVPRKLAEHWVITAEEVLPLLDGLDEVVREYRDDCVERINEFRSQHFLPIAVCSRWEDYQRLSGRLRLPAAVVVQPLTRGEVDEHLDRGGEPLAALRTAVAGDPTLLELLDTPLMLSIATLAYRRVADREALERGTLEDRRKHLFARYVDAMFERRAKEARYTREQTLPWLKWLASSMMRRGQSDFQLEALNRDWLPTRGQQALLSWSVVLAIGLTIGLVGGLAGWVFGGLVGWKQADTLRWSWPKLSHFDLRVGLGVALFCGLVGGLGIGLVSGLVTLLNKGFVTAEVNTRSIPNDGTRRSGLNALVGGLSAGLVVGLTIGLVGGLVNVLVGGLAKGLSGGLVKGLSGGLVWGLVLGLVYAIDKGAGFFLQHWGMRLMLWRYRHAPFQYVRFLDYAAERILLRKVGGGYIFVHRMLMEYFALWKVE